MAPKATTTVRIASSLRVGITSLAAVGVASLLGACDGAISSGGERPEVLQASAPGHVDEEFGRPAPMREEIGSGSLTPARSIRRLSADQLARALAVATGESWTSYEQFADALGRPDWLQTTSEGLSVSAGVERVWNDAARATCALAMTHDDARAASERVILRYVDLSHQDDADDLENVAYLVRRFHSFDVPADEADPRLVPWLRLLRAPLPGAADDFADTPAERRERWQAVCVGLALHPDFLSY